MHCTVELPFECTQHLLSFLELEDCLRFGAASSTILQQTLPNLLGRRNRMKDRYAIVTNEYKAVKPPSPTSTITQDIASVSQEHPSPKEFGLLTDLQQVHSKENLLLFPTVQDRIERLAAKMPPLHSLAGTVVELRDSLRLDLANKQGTNEAGRAGSAPSASNKDELVALLRQITLPLKLHAQILRQALRSPDNNNNVCPLHEYVGDVLCVTYLLSSSDSTHSCSCAEGSPTQLSVATDAHPAADTNSYASWVLLHSGILRTKLFSESERTTLGIPEFEGVQHNTNTSTSTGRLSWMAALYHRRTSAWSLSTDRFRNDAFMASELTLVYDEFGPLGPSFRGRDVVRIRQVSAQCLLAYYSCPPVPRQQQQQQQQGDRGAAGRVALEWICLAHEQASRTRPMTVREPVIRFS